MNLKTFASLMKGGKMPVLLRFKLMFSSFYRLSFFASMVDTVFLERLSRGPVTAENLLEEFGNDPALRNAIESWLGLGVRLGVLKKCKQAYCLRGFLAKRLARPENDAIRALVREVASLHHFYIMQTPAKLRKTIYGPLRINTTSMPISSLGQVGTLNLFYLNSLTDSSPDRGPDAFWRWDAGMRVISCTLWIEIGTGALSGWNLIRRWPTPRETRSD